MNKLLQYVNLGATIKFIKIIRHEKQLAIPHITVKSIAGINWRQHKDQGFKGVVFDVDNTLTVPYESHVSNSSIQQALEECKSVFEGRVAILSNSAGLEQYDPQGVKAGALERGLGVRVIRHRAKKPQVDPLEVQQHFSCPTSQLLVVGDRVLTDVVLGNRLGACAVLVAPLAPERDIIVVKLVRGLEGFLLARWARKGVKPPTHPLLKDEHQTDGVEPQQ